jgi:hypothetical protein
VENVVADHLARMNHEQDDKEPIEDKMRYKMIKSP